MAVIPHTGAGGTRLAQDPADLFAQLYDLLSNECPRPGEVQELDSWLLELPERGLAARVEDQVLQLGTVGSLGDTLPEHGEERARWLYEALVGLDRALGHLHPQAGARTPPALRPIAHRLETTGQLATSQHGLGAVVPRSGALPSPLPPLTSWNDCFEYVLRVGDRAWREAEYVTLPPRYRLTPQPDGVVRVGLLPFVADGELEWHVRDTAEGARYSVGPRSERLLSRIDDALAALDAGGVDIGVLPEASADTRLVERWQQRVRGTPPPTRSRLQWILVGTGPDRDDHPAANRGWLLHRQTGEVFAHQDKRNGFRIECDLAERWGVDELLPELPCDEDIVTEDPPRVLDGGLARVAVLICEDLASLTDNGACILAFAPTHVVVPVVSDSVDPERWQHKEAEDSFGDSRTVVIVSNGLALSHVGQGERFNTGLAWRTGQEPELHAAEHPLDVGVVGRRT